MKDVLLLTMLRALDDRDTDTADSCVGLASDPEALGVLLADDYSEGYTQGEYDLLTEAERAGFVRKTGTDSRGRKYTRWVRAEQPKADRKAVAAESKAKAKAMIEMGVKGAAQARLLASHLKNLTVADIDELRKLHAVKASGRIKQAKVDTLVAYAQGRGSVEQARAAVKPEMPKAEPKVEPKAVTRDVQDRMMSNLIADLERERHANTRLVPIHELRDEIRKRFGDDAASHRVFNDILNDMRMSGRVRLIPIDDRSRASASELSGSIESAVGTLFYIERA